MRLTPSLSMRYFRRYIERVINADSRRTWNPIVGWKEVGRKRWAYGEHRPWTDQFKHENRLNKRYTNIPVEPIKEWNIFIGDRVKILVGDDKGKIGLVNHIIKERNWVYVEGLNCEYMMKEVNDTSVPVCMKNEKPLLVTSQVALIDPADNEATSIQWRYTSEGERVRVSQRTWRIVPLPSGYHTLEDHVNPRQYTPCDKDCHEDDVLEVTFQAKLKTFEQDINESMNIKDDRKRPKTYWY